MMHQQKFDGVLALYHDQGLIPFKSIAFSSGVNFTAGLSVVRTSPDHGTAYAIAGKNIADCSSMRAALFLASDIVERHSPSTE
jgi:4-hydroxythreonine-4-phosphate dehydrogenase